MYKDHSITLLEHTRTHTHTHTHLFSLPPIPNSVKNWQFSRNCFRRKNAEFRHWGVLFERICGKLCFFLSVYQKSK